ncbi:MAG: SpoIIE family protein phosphatase [Bacteroidota bacterium]
MKKFLLVIFYLFSLMVSLNAQNNISKLEKRLRTESGKDKFHTQYKLSKLYLTISPKKSLSYAIKAYENAKKLESLNMQANALNLIGTAYYKQEKYKLTIRFYEKELTIREKLNQKTSEAKTLFNIGTAYEANKKERKALISYQQALKAAKSIKYPDLVYKAYESIIRIFTNQNNFKEAFWYLQESNIYKGATKVTREQRKINILETKYEERKKELKEKESELSLIDSTLSIIQLENETLEHETARKNIRINNLTTETEEQRLTIAVKDAEVKRHRQWLISFAVFFTLILIFSILLYKSYKEKKKAIKLLAMQNTEILEKNEEIASQSDELQIQRDIALKSKQEIIDSINYAKRIQKAIFPSKNYVNEILQDYFVLLKPRDIVSGDFYWIKKIRNFTIIAVADCTGHGVPGAFMSMLGISFLNEIVGPKSLESTDVILNHLRNKVKKSLRQKGKDGETKDGMDIALYIINTETLELQYSGAYNPLYIISEDTKPQLNIIKADRQPIAVHVIENDFTNHKFQLKKGDCLYSFSDGYTAQFGGKNGQKFKPNNFKEVLLANYKKPMSEQKKVLTKTIDKWMGKNHEQVDDIIVLGVRV